MFSRNRIPVWTGILVLSGMFLMGQETWPPELPQDMAQIPDGCFDMGDAFSEGDLDELPVHNVCISAFAMDVYEVTNADYAECVADDACTAPRYSSSASRTLYYGNPAYDDYPVIYVDWNQAADYCAWAGKRLPTEAEWEYAARGWLPGKRYPWGDAISGSNANYWDSGDPEDNDTNAVGSYLVNGYGLHDMAGNVWEWVNDWYQSDYYSVSPSSDPPGPPSGTFRVLRGGSWYSSTFGLRVAFRNYDFPTDSTSNYFGFRCARDLSTPPTPCTDTAEASVYEAKPAYKPSDLGKHLAFFLLPLGAVLLLGTLRRRK